MSKKRKKKKSGLARALPFLIGGAVLLLIGCVGVGGVYAVRSFLKYATLAWKPYDWPDGRCRIDMPGSPVRDRQQAQPTPAGVVTLYVKYVELPFAGVEAAVMYADFPVAGPAPQPDAVLNAAAEGVGRSLEATIARRTGITTDGHRGLEVAGTAKNKPGEFVIRMFMVDRRLYQVIFAGRGVADGSASVKRFFDSFRLTAPAAPDKPRPGGDLGPFPTPAL